VNDVELTLCVLLWAREGQAAALVEYEDQVLQLISEHGGTVLQRARTTGTDGDPLEIRTQIKHLFINGNQVPLTSRHTELYEKYKADGFEILGRKPLKEVPRIGAAEPKHRPCGEIDRSRRFPKSAVIRHRPVVWRRRRRFFHGMRISLCGIAS